MARISRKEKLRLFLEASEEEKIYYWKLLRHDVQNCIDFLQFHGYLINFCNLRDIEEFEEALKFHDALHKAAKGIESLENFLKKNRTFNE